MSKQQTEKKVKPLLSQARDTETGMVTWQISLQVRYDGDRLYIPEQQWGSGILVVLEIRHWTSPNEERAVYLMEHGDITAIMPDQEWGDHITRAIEYLDLDAAAVRHRLTEDGVRKMSDIDGMDAVVETLEQAWESVKDVVVPQV